MVAALDHAAIVDGGFGSAFGDGRTSLADALCVEKSASTQEGGRPPIHTSRRGLIESPPMRVRGRRRKSIVFFITLSACLVALAIALNVGWIILNWREVALLVLGIVFFIVLIFGLVLNTTFLIREIRRNEQHDAFINAVTHELKLSLIHISEP